MIHFAETTTANSNFRLTACLTTNEMLLWNQIPPQSPSTYNQALGSSPTGINKNEILLREEMI